MEKPLFLKRLLLISFVIIFGLTTKINVANDMELRVNQSRELSKKLVNSLAKILKKTIANEGPIQAILVCKQKAPELSAKLSEETGWEISRVSLKPRNKNLGIPDEWERAMLQNFDRRNKDGEITQNLEIAEYTLEADGRYFRYIKALETKPICLTCHGKVENISPQILQILQHNYPSDQATGYSVGLIRGAISIKQSLNTD